MMAGGDSTEFGLSSAEFGFDSATTKPWLEELKASSVANKDTAVTLDATKPEGNSFPRVLDLVLKLLEEFVGGKLQPKAAENAKMTEEAAERLARARQEYSDEDFLNGGLQDHLRSVSAQRGTDFASGPSERQWDSSGGAPLPGSSAGLAFDRPADTLPVATASAGSPPGDDTDDLLFRGGSGAGGGDLGGGASIVPTLSTGGLGGPLGPTGLPIAAGGLPGPGGMGLPGAGLPGAGLPGAGLPGGTGMPMAGMPMGAMMGGMGAMGAMGGAAVGGQQARRGRPANVPPDLMDDERQRGPAGRGPIGGGQKAWTAQGAPFPGTAWDPPAGSAGSTGSSAQARGGSTRALGGVTGSGAAGGAIGSGPAGGSGAAGSAGGVLGMAPGVAGRAGRDAGRSTSPRRPLAGTDPRDEGDTAVPGNGPAGSSLAAEAQVASPWTPQPAGAVNPDWRATGTASVAMPTGAVTSSLLPGIALPLADPHHRPARRTRPVTAAGHQDRGIVGQQRVPVLEPLPSGVSISATTGRPVDADGNDLPTDEVTGLPVLDGVLLDPYTGRPLQPAGPGEMVLDPTTRLLLNPRTGTFADPVTLQPLMPDPISGFLTHTGTGQLVAQDTGLHYDADSGRLVDPSTGAALRIDPESGLPVDPVTNELIDPETGELVDPGTGRPLPRDLDSGLLVVGPSRLLDPATGIRYDRTSGLPLDDSWPDD